MMNDIKIAPSVLSADFAHLAQDLDSISTCDYIHYDVMDGHFVPNLTFGLDILKAVKRTTDIPVDVHLMITNPDEMVPLYLEAGADVVTFHMEATSHANRLAALIRDAGAKASVAINPGTSVSTLDAIIDDVDMVLLMTVNPGFGGQKFIPGSLRKLEQLSHMCAEHGVSPMVEVDGGISAANAADVCAAGANVLVAGSAVFKAEDRAQAIASIREAGRDGIVKRA
jgi:ribulose-phosphate 3-epimerase